MEERIWALESVCTSTHLFQVVLWVVVFGWVVLFVNGNTGINGIRFTRRLCYEVVLVTGVFRVLLWTVHVLFVLIVSLFLDNVLQFSWQAWSLGCVGKSLSTTLESRIIYSSFLGQHPRALPALMWWHSRYTNNNFHYFDFIVGQLLRWNFEIPALTRQL